jgi:hypothetical protein
MDCCSTSLSFSPPACAVHRVVRFCTGFTWSGLMAASKAGSCSFTADSLMRSEKASTSGERRNENCLKRQKDKVCSYEAKASIRNEKASMPAHR